MPIARSTSRSDLTIADLPILGNLPHDDRRLDVEHALTVAVDRLAREVVESAFVAVVGPHHIVDAAEGDRHEDGLLRCRRPDEARPLAVIKFKPLINAKKITNLTFSTPIKQLTGRNEQ